VSGPTAGLSRRALFGLGGTTVLAAAAATAWRWRSTRAEASTPGRAEPPVTYADHDGWMVSPAEKQALRAQPPPQPPPGGAP
jgi:hypothetical protein